MHIVAAAWLFVVGTMSLTFGSALAGAAFFLVAGAAPLAFYAWVKLRALGGRSGLEERAHDRDDRDAGADQR